MAALERLAKFDIFLHGCFNFIIFLELFGVDAHPVEYSHRFHWNLHFCVIFISFQNSYIKWQTPMIF